MTKTMSNDEVFRQQCRYAGRNASVVRNPEFMVQFRDWADQWRDTQPLGSKGLQNTENSHD